MPPMTMLRRFDRVLAPTKAKLEVDAKADRLALGSAGRANLLPHA